MRNAGKIFSFAAISLALIVAGAGTAIAQPATPEQFGTPDNLPPALEDVCDMTSGAANGLCVAFCEAMDCDSDAPLASEQACTKVGDNFMRLTGELPPCLRTCPCWEEEELNNVTAENHNSTNSCPGTAIPELIQARPGATGDAEGGFAVDTAGFVVGAPACFTRTAAIFLVITAEEAEVCAEQIRNRCAEIGHPF